MRPPRKSASSRRLLPAGSRVWQPALTVDAYGVTDLQSTLGNFGQLCIDVATKRSRLTEKNEALREAVMRVDQNNKRWFKAWQGQFATGTAARTALNQIYTGPSQALPGQGVSLLSELLPNQRVRVSFDAARAKVFKLLHKGPGEAGFSVLAEGLTLKTFEHAATPGLHTYKVQGGHDAGTGAESVELTLNVAEAAAA